MKINISAVKKNRGESLALTFALPVADLLPEQSHSFAGELKVKGSVTNVGSGLLVAGELETLYNDNCARCLQNVSKKVQLDFAEEFFVENSLQLKDNHYKYEGDFLDLSELIRELLLLEQPLRTVCREECQGLCPVCGCDLNITACGCVKESIDPRLINLRKYLEK